MPEVFVCLCLYFFLLTECCDRKYKSQIILCAFIVFAFTFLKSQTSTLCFRFFLQRCVFLVFVNKFVEISLDTLWMPSRYV